MCAALFIDPRDAHVTVKSDPLPTILQEGIQLRIRRVGIVVDRPGFIVTPTSCTPKQISGVIHSDQGAAANVSSYFQVGGCGAANLPTSAKDSLCSSAAKLVMPTTITGQNGAQVTQTTKIAITGCPKAKSKAKAKSTSLTRTLGGRRQRSVTAAGARGTAG